MLRLVISGGQTGADRASLNAAKLHGIPTGGTAPKGWRICLPDGKNGSDPSLAELGLIEHESYDYPPRSRKNVNDSDATAWFGFPGSGGAKVTLDAAEKAGKPTIINPSPQELIDWILDKKIQVLNVAGNRASDLNPGVYQETFEILSEAFGWLRNAYMEMVRAGDVVVLMLACNDHRNGAFEGILRGVQLADSEILNLETCLVDDEDATELSGLDITFDAKNGWFKVASEKAYTVPIVGRQTWVGNWCWDSVSVELSEAVKFLNWLMQTNSFHCLNAVDVLHDAWHDGQPLAEELLREVLS